MTTPIVSYAQNFEDVMLWRALGHIECGQYVDIGAQSPLVDSVSMAFHQNGWRGVHVEPVEIYAQELRAARPGDLVIQALVGDRYGLHEFYTFAGTGLSTAESAIAQEHADAGRSSTRTSMPMVALDDVLGNLEGDVHWLKIDVEGAESRVLEGWKGQCRPWIVVVESTSPMTQIETFEQWESRLLEKQYEFVYFDGLNRFYVHQEHPELKAAFQAGPNVFDQFQLSGTASSTFTLGLQQRIDAGETELARLRGIETDLRQRIESSEHEVARLIEIETRQAGEIVARDHAIASLEEARELLEQQIEALTSHVTRLAEIERRQAGEIEDRDQTIARLDEAEARLLQEIESLNRVVVSKEEDRLALEQEAQLLRVNMQTSAAALDHLRAQIDELHRSTSWRVTAPLRWTKFVLMQLVQFVRRSIKGAILAFKKMVMAVVFAVLKWSNGKPRIVSFGKRLSAAFPPAERRVRRWRSHVSGLPAPQQVELHTQPLPALEPRVPIEPVPQSVSIDAGRALQRLRQMLQQEAV